MSKKIPLELIERELSESDLDGLTKMMVDIELKTQDGIEPMLAGILSHFRCDGCGECCRNAPAVMTDDELVAIAKRTGNEAFDALDGDILVNAFRSPCHFLTERGCRIYDIKPRVCRLYPLSLKNMGFVTLILCPMGKKIQTELENFIKSSLDNCFSGIGITIPRGTIHPALKGLGLYLPLDPTAVNTFNAGLNL